MNIHRAFKRAIPIRDDTSLCQREVLNKPMDPAQALGGRLSLLALSNHTRVLPILRVVRSHTRECPRSEAHPPFAHATPTF